jgi:hypothetical protein
MAILQFDLLCMGGIPCKPFANQPANQTQTISQATTLFGVTPMQTYLQTNLQTICKPTYKPFASQIGP